MQGLQFLILNILSIVLTYNTCACTPKSPEVFTSLGKIRGANLTTRFGRNFYAFRGVRYAEPPVGDLRFRDPRPVRAWSPASFDATTDGPMCPQVTANRSDASEDCLRLNVYTTDLKASKPVLVYLHPGGFYSVTAQSKLTGSQHLMEREIVLVTVNYRLGSLGLLATGTADAPGNAALKDQVIALRWVQAHIRAFGGNPDSVTLFGYSAGSLSIGLHLVSPMSRGLFHRAIMMSASPTSQVAYSTSQLKLAHRQACLLQCPIEPASELVKCLRSRPMDTFIDTMASMFDFSWNPVLNWKPVIELDFGQERFLTEDPVKMLQRGDFQRVPLITGITEYEFIYIAYNVLKNKTMRSWFNDEFNKYAPITFLYADSPVRSDELSATLRSEYLRNETLTLPASLEPFGELYSDSLIGFAFHRFLNLVAERMPVYTYLFTYKGRYSHFKYPLTNQSYGAVHHDELLYLFRAPFMTPPFSETDPENDTIERLTRMWSEFATKGDPNNPNDKYLANVNWNLYTSANKEFLEIGEKLSSRTGGFYQQRFQLWDKLFPLEKL